MNILEMSLFQKELRIFADKTLAELDEEKDIFGNERQRVSADYYYTSEGFIVFTEAYHLKRGYCCQSGCKHCPYGFDKKTGKFKE